MSVRLMQACAAMMAAWALFLAGLIGLSLAVGVYEFLVTNSIFLVVSVGFSFLFWDAGKRARQRMQEMKDDYS